MSEDECEDCRSFEETIQNLEGIEEGLTKDVSELKDRIEELEETEEKLRDALSEISHTVRDAMK